LAAKDSLQTTITHPDTSDFSPEGGVRPTTFWRSSQQTHARVRNPLLTPGTGVTIKSFAVDWMHCLSLGVFAHLLGHLMVELSAADAWDLRCGKALAEELGLGMLRAALSDLCSSEEREGRSTQNPKPLRLACHEALGRHLF
jgi:hypothetical protein